MNKLTPKSIFDVDDVIDDVTAWLQSRPSIFCLKEIGNWHNIIKSTKISAIDSGIGINAGFVLGSVFVISYRKISLTGLVEVPTSRTCSFGHISTLNCLNILKCVNKFG